MPATFLNDYDLQIYISEENYLLFKGKEKKNNRGLCEIYDYVCRFVTLHWIGIAA